MMSTSIRRRFAAIAPSLVFLLLVSWSGLGGSPAVLAKASRAATTTLSIVYVSTTDLTNTYQNKFKPGSGIRYFVKVHNSGTTTLTCEFQFLAFWGRARVDQTMDKNTIENGGPYTASVPAGDSVWYTQGTIPSRTTPGQFTYRATVWEAANQQNRAAASTSFWVNGWLFVKNASGNTVPYYSQWRTNDQYSQYNSGPASVAMVRAFYNAFPSSTTPTRRIKDVRNYIVNTFGEKQEPEETAVRYALIDQIEGYNGISYQYIYRNANTPSSDEADMASAVQTNSIIVLVNGQDLGRSYTWHWVVVIGFYCTASSTYVIVNDPDSTYTGISSYSYITLGAFSKAISSAPSDSSVDAFIVG